MNIWLIYTKEISKSFAWRSEKEKYLSIVRNLKIFDMQFCKNNLVLQITEILIERHNGNFDKCDDCYRGKRSKREVQDFLALAPNWVQSCDGCTWHLPLSMIFSSSPLLLFSTLSLSFFFQFYFYFNFHYFFFTFTLIFTWHLSTLDDLLQFSFTFILNTFT